MDPEFLEKFTSHLKSVLVRAYTLAHELGDETISIEHLLWSLLTERGSIGSEILTKVQLSPERIRERIAEHSKIPATPSEDMPKLADATKRAIEQAVHTAHEHDHKYVGTEHLLQAMLATDAGSLKDLLQAEQVDVSEVRDQLLHVLKSTPRLPETTPAPATRTKTREEGTRSEPKKKQSKTPALDFFTVDLTAAEAQKRLDPLIGRAAEVDRLVEILSRRTKNNPLLLGDPGVGKTALVEGLARRIAAGEVPDVLRKKKIHALDLALVVAGTMYRGEFEGRFKQLIEEVRSHPDVILFLDEVHTLSGAGSASGSLDAANMLKPSLARGDIRCIGATTYAEYKKHIESDAALERRFQIVDVREPTAEETRAILAGIAPGFAAFHDVAVLPEAVDAAVHFAGRYLPERRFPDKAIDLLDEACAAIRVRATARPAITETHVLETAIEEAERKKDQAVADERFQDALAWKEKENRLQKQLEALKTMRPARAMDPLGSVTAATVADVVARMTGIPARELDQQDTARLLQLEQALAARVVGQEAAVAGVSDAIRRARAGLGAPERPLASFLFLGPSGVGKTELAKQIAATVYQDPSALVRMDMSEFGESFTVSKLIGAPAGYVGYREGNSFTDRVKRRPYSVVLFDEVEKAHPDVLNVLLQILEDGVLTDSTGRKVSFAQTIIVLTSNVGLERYQRGALGFGNTSDATAAAEADIRSEARNRFRPELLNRIDRIFVFQPLEHKHLEAVVRLELNSLHERLVARGSGLVVQDEAVTFLATQAHDPEKGARAVRALVEQQVESPAAKLLLGRGRTPRSLTLAVHNQALAISRTVRKRVRT